MVENNSKCLKLFFLFVLRTPYWKCKIINDLFITNKIADKPFINKFNRRFSNKFETLLQFITRKNNYFVNFLQEHPYICIYFKYFLVDLKKNVFSSYPAESKFFLPLVFTKMLLSGKGMRKNSIILTSGGNRECRKSQA